MPRLLTIGHSTHTSERFLDLLRCHGVGAIADVRSTPASRFAPQFNREAIRRALAMSGVRYVFLGKELGARSADPSCYVHGKVQYERLARTPQFQSGISRILDGASRGTVALMCTEREPLDCHRAILVSKVLVERGAEVSHILGDGSLEGHAQAMLRLRKKHHLDQPSLLDTEDELLKRALALQESEIAFVDDDLVGSA